MLDPALEVLQVKTDERDLKYVTPEELVELKKKHSTEPPIVVKRAGEQGQFSGAEARRWGFVGYLAADRRDVARALQLPSTAIEDDPSLDGGWKAVRVDLKGPLLADTVRKAQHMIEEQIRQEQVNFICLWIDSPGGSVADALQLANFLGDLDPSKVRTVAYVPSEARSDAAIIALACDQLVVHPRTVLGGSGAHELSPDEIQRRGPRDPRVGAPQGTIVVVDGGDDRSPSRRLSRHARGRRRVLLQRRAQRTGGAGQVENGRARHQARQAAASRWNHGGRVSPGQLRRRAISPNSSNATGWKTIRRWSSPGGRRC